MNELDRVAMFPLPDIVLFPGALLPLHIFEPRYREMAANVLTQDQRLLVMARLRPGYAKHYHQRPAVFPIAGLGEILAAERLADGRYQMLVRGVARVEIEREHPPDLPYRVVQCNELSDRATSHSAIQESSARLRKLCMALAEELREDGEALANLCDATPNPVRLADILASGLMRGAESRQALLENLDPIARMEAVCQEIGRQLIAATEPRGPLN
jgi:Lon protease-like protein